MVKYFMSALHQKLQYALCQYILLDSFPRKKQRKTFLASHAKLVFVRWLPSIFMQQKKKCMVTNSLLDWRSIFTKRIPRINKTSPCTLTTDSYSMPYVRHMTLDLRAGTYVRSADNRTLKQCKIYQRNDVKGWPPTCKCDTWMATHLTAILRCHRSLSTDHGIVDWFSILLRG